MPNDKQPQNPAEFFTEFWTDFMSRSGAASESSNGSGVSPAFSPTAKQMQQMFFDAMAKYAEEFMRSEQFLTSMKQTMDQSLKFKQLVDDFLTKAQRSMQSPVSADIDDMASLLRGIEERIFERLGRLEEKIAAVEEQQRSGRDAEASRAKRPSAPSTPNKSKSKRKPKRSR